MTVGAKSSNLLAVRPGVIYTSTGKARFGLPTGDYTIYAGRGFEYSLDSVRIKVSSGDAMQKSLALPVLSAAVSLEFGRFSSDFLGFWVEFG
jgi:hypothetical protein